MCNTMRVQYGFYFQLLFLILSTVIGEPSDLCLSYTCPELTMNLTRTIRQKPVTDLIYTTQNGRHFVFDDGDFYKISCICTPNDMDLEKIFELQVNHIGINLVKISTPCDDTTRILNLPLPLVRLDDGFNVSCTIREEPDDVIDSVYFMLVANKRSGTLIKPDETLNPIEGSTIQTTCKGVAYLIKSSFEDPKLLTTKNGKILENFTMSHNGTYVRCATTTTNEKTGVIDLNVHTWMIIVETATENINFEHIETSTQKYNGTTESVHVQPNTLQSWILYVAIALIVICIIVFIIIICYRQSWIRRLSVKLTPVSPVIEPTETDTPCEAISQEPICVSVVNKTPEDNPFRPPQVFPRKDTEDDMPYSHYDTPYDHTFRIQHSKPKTNLGDRPKLFNVYQNTRLLIRKHRKIRVDIVSTDKSLCNINNEQTNRPITVIPRGRPPLIPPCGQMLDALGVSQRHVVPGASQRDVAPGVSQRGNSRGINRASQRGVVTGANQRCVVSGASHRDIVPGASHRDDVLRPSQRGVISGASQRDVIPRAQRCIASGASHKDDVPRARQRGAVSGASQREVVPGAKRSVVSGASHKDVPRARQRGVVSGASQREVVPGAQRSVVSGASQREVVLGAQRSVVSGASHKDVVSGASQRGVTRGANHRGVTRGANQGRCPRRVTFDT